MANDWEQLADRSHSILNEYTDLQQILLKWRRLEVLSWSHIIEQVKKEFKENCIISSFPLFEAFDKFLTNEIQEDKVILMLIDWIQNATLVDFDFRLFSGNLLAFYIDQKITTNDKISSNLSLRVRIIVNYFRIFQEKISDQFNENKKEVENKLKDFVEIFKYNDLNLWSVKQSTQKVHAQLFRFIKIFKVNLFIL